MKNIVFAIFCLVFCSFYNLFAQNKTKIGVNLTTGLGVSDGIIDSDVQIGIPISMTIGGELKFLTGVEVAWRNHRQQTKEPTRLEGSGAGFGICLFCSESIIYEARQVQQFTLQVPLILKMEYSTFTWVAGVVPSYGLGGVTKEYERRKGNLFSSKVFVNMPETEVKRSLNYKSDAINRMDYVVRGGIGLRGKRMEFGFLANYGFYSLSNGNHYKPMNSLNFVLSVDYFFVKTAKKAKNTEGG